MISSEKTTSLDRIAMAADNGNTAPVSVAERIAALQGRKGRSSTRKQSTALKLQPPPITMPKRTNALANRIATFQNTNTADDDLFHSDDAILSSDKTQTNELEFPSSVAASPDVSVSSASVVSPTWKARTPMSKPPVSGNELKFCAALLTQSPQVVRERDCDGGELEAVEVAVIKLDVDEEEDNLKVDDSNVKQTENSCNESAAELPIFMYTVPLKGAMHNNSPTSEQKKLPDSNATSNDESISFDSLPQEYLNSTWNLPPQQCQELVESFSSDDMFLVKASNTKVDVEYVTPKKLTEQLIPETDETEAVLAKSLGNSHGLEAVKEELLPEDHPPKIQQTEKPSLVSEARAAILLKRAAKQEKLNQVSPTGVDNFRTEEEAQNKFRFEGVNNETVISSISAVTPDETIQSGFTRIFGDDPYAVDEQEKNLVDNSLIVQNLEHGCFNARQLITKSITSKEILIGVIESSLGVLADTVAEGYDLVASEFQDSLGSEKITT